MLDDGVAVLEAAGLQPARTIAFGRSVGSIYALHLASQVPGLAGLILESGIAEPLQRVLLRVSADELGVTTDELARAGARWLDHRAKLARYGGPTLVMHTRHDGLVDLRNAEQLAAWAAEPCKLVVFEQGNHNSILAQNWRAYWDEVERFVASLAERSMLG